MPHHRFSVVVLAAALGGTPLRALGAQGTDPSAFIAHLDVLVPRLLHESGIPGAAVGLVRHGEVIGTWGWGLADTTTRRPVGPETPFNVGSIAKTVTAWGIMKLVARGRIVLDAPVRRYLTRWDLPRGPFDPDRVTIRGLLEHTAGISLPAVPARPAGTEPPPLEMSLADPAAPVRIALEPGTAWQYSGGGYMILQLLVEEVSGRPFADFMRDEILLPLGMAHSFFGPPGSRARAAPYSATGPAPNLYWPGMAAADFYSTAVDLARFVAAASDSPTARRGRGVLPPAAIDAMIAPSAASRTRTPPLRYGLGHEIWPLPDGSPAVGHNGQNDGWAAAAWWIPATGDGIVVLTNHSDGMAVHRWIVCDWLSWHVGPAWGPYCRGRPAHAAGRLPLGDAGNDDTLAARIERTLEAAVPDASGPGVAVSIRRAGRELFAGARGVADRETGAALTPQSVFYVASVAKPITAALVGLLIDRGILAPDDSLGRYVDGLGALGHATIGQLLDQRSGIPDYLRWIQWPRLRSLDNAGVIDSLRAHPTPDFAPGARFAYSNANYILLAEVVRRAVHQALGELVRSEFQEPLALPSFYVDESDHPPPDGTVHGYVPEGATYRLSDYETLDVPGAGFRARFAFAVTGAGGLYASAPDLTRWGEAVLDGRVPGLPRVAPRPWTDPGGLGATVGRVTGYVRGWFVGDFADRRVLWHDGNRGGFGAVIVLVPSDQITLAVLSNRSDLEPERLASALLALLWPGTE